MKDTRTDPELIAAYQKGDENAFFPLFERHKDKIFTSIYCLVKDREVAEDIFQDTFIKITHNLRKGNYVENALFAPWGLRIAYNLCIDYFRKKKRKPPIVELDVESGTIFEEEEDDDEYDEKAHQADIKDLLEQLPEVQREVVILRHFFNLSFKEIADKTNTPINTCLGRMRYALITLRKIMEEKKIARKTTSGNLIMVKSLGQLN